MKLLEELTWVLVFGGLITASLGLFVALQPSGAALGATLIVAGALAALAGIVLIIIQARRP